MNSTRAQASPLRWLIFLAMAGGLALALVMLPRALANGLLLGGLLLSATLGARRYRRELRVILRPFIRAWARSRGLYATTALPWLRAHQGAVSAALGAAALWALTAGVAQFAQQRDNAALDSGFRLVYLGVALTWGALAAARLGADEASAAAGSPVTAPPTALTSTRFARRMVAGVGVLCFALMIEINGGFLRAGALAQTSHHAQFALLLAGLAALIYGLAAPRPRAKDARLRGEALALVALTAGALILRVHQLDAIRAFIDEVNFISPVRAFWFRDDVPLIQPMSSIAAFPYLYPYLQALGVEFFGRNLVGLRIISAVFGALTVPALFLLARELWDRRVAWIAAALLACFPLHLQFSRIGLNNIAEPLFGVLALAMLARGVRRLRAGESPGITFALAGACLGLTQYFYEGGRLAFPAIIIGWALAMRLTHWRGVPGLSRALATTLLAAVVVAIPIYTTLLSMERPLAHRMSRVALDVNYWGSLDGVSAFVRDLGLRVRFTALLFVSRPETALYYAGDYGLLLPFIAPFTLLGAAVVAWRWRRPGELLLLIWVGGTLAALMLFFRQADSPRQMVIAPALMLLAALGLDALLRLIPPRLPRLARALAVGMTGALALFSLVYYFGVHIERFNWQVHAVQPGQALNFAAAQLPPKTHAHLIDTPIISQGDARASVEFLADGVEVFTLVHADVDDEWLAGLSRGVNQAFYVAEWEAEVIARLRAHFPTLSPPLPVDNRYTPHRYYALFIAPAEPAADAAARHPSSGSGDSTPKRRVPRSISQG